MPGIGPAELAVILLVIVIIFGVGKLPEIGGALGKGIREFKRETGYGEDPEPIRKPREIETGTSATIRAPRSAEPNTVEDIKTTGTGRQVRPDDV